MFALLSAVQSKSNRPNYKALQEGSSACLDRPVATIRAGNLDLKQKIESIGTRESSEPEHSRRIKNINRVLHCTGVTSVWVSAGALKIEVISSVQSIFFRKKLDF